MIIMLRSKEEYVFMYTFDNLTSERVKHFLLGFRPCPILNCQFLLNHVQFWQTATFFSTTLNMLNADPPFLFKCFHDISGVSL